MTAVLSRYYEENRRLLTALALVLLGNVLFYIVLSGPAQLRARALKSDLGSAREQSHKALGEFGRALLEHRLHESATARIETLDTEVLGTRRDRFARVDQRFKEIAAKFRLEANTYNYGYVDLIPERLERQAVAFNLKGSYDNLRRFVAEVEQARDAEGNDLFFAIDRVELADPTDSGAELNLTIGVNTFYHKPELAEIEKTRGGRRP